MGLLEWAPSAINLLSSSYSRLHLIYSKNELLQDKISADMTEVGHASTVTQEAGCWVPSPQKGCNKGEGVVKPWYLGLGK